MLSFNKILKTGVYFVTTEIGFTTHYFDRLVQDILICKKALGQEAELLHSLKNYRKGERPLMGKCNLRDHLLHAAEAYALAEQNPSMVKKFNIERPAWHEDDNRDTLWTKIPSGLRSLGFD